MRRVKVALRWGLPALATLVSLLVGQSLKWRLTSEIVLAFAAGAFVFGVAWLLIYFGALELRHQKVAIALALIPAIIVFGIFAQASGFWGFVALISGDERAGKAEKTVQAVIAARVETPLAVKHATVQADKEVPGAMKWVVGQAYKAFQPTPTETPPGYIAPPTATPTMVPGEVRVAVVEILPTGLTEPVIGAVTIEVLLEPEGTVIGVCAPIKGTIGKYSYPGRLDKGTKYRLRVKSVPSGFDTQKVKLLDSQSKKEIEPVFTYTGEVDLAVVLTRSAR